MKMVAKIIKEDSIIQFSAKAFIALIVTILGVFFSFYLLVIEPQFKAQDEKIEKNWSEQKQINKELSNSMNQLNITLTSLSTIIETQKKEKN